MSTLIRNLQCTFELFIVHISFLFSIAVPPKSRCNSTFRNFQIAEKFPTYFSATIKPTTENRIFPKVKQNHKLKQMLSINGINGIIMVLETFHGPWALSEKISWQWDPSSWFYYNKKSLAVFMTTHSSEIVDLFLPVANFRAIVIFKLHNLNKM